MSYRTIQPPFTLQFREMSKQELKKYFQWFLSATPKRISVLTEAVRQSPGFETWEADGSPSSLERLGDWFAAKVETRQRTEMERQEIKSRSTIHVEVPSEELTNQSFSMAMDIGMYLAEALMREHPSLKWDQPLTDKKFVDYGQAVIIGFGTVPLNPVRIAVTLAYGLADKKQTGKRLHEIYSYWSKQVKKS